MKCPKCKIGEYRLCRIEEVVVNYKIDNGNIDWGNYLIDYADTLETIGLICRNCGHTNKDITIKDDKIEM